MAHRYSPEQRDFIAANIKGRRYAALAELMTERFGITFTTEQIHAYAQNHKLTNGMPSGPLIGERPKLFPEEILNFIRENAEGKTNAELWKLVNATFGTSYTQMQVKQVKQRNHISSGLDGRFQPGQTSHNKGKKGQYAPGSEKGWFRAGHSPHNHLEVGAEVMTTDGYPAVKIAEPNVWKLKHVLVWEAANGPVPEGHAIIFLDQDHTNTNLENLALVSRAELLELNRRELITSNAELTTTGILIARVNCKISKIKRAKKEANKKCRKSRKPSEAPSASTSETREKSHPTN